MKLHLAVAPRIRAVKQPKLFRITVSKAANGATVSHHFHGAPSRQFVFTNPTKMASHLNRALRGEWLHPDARSEAHTIEHDIEIA